MKLVNTNSIEATYNAMLEMMSLAEIVAAEIHQWEQLAASGAVPTELQRAYLFDWRNPEVYQRQFEQLRNRGLPNPVLNLAAVVKSLRGNVHALLEQLKYAASMMDDPADPLPKRWSVRVRECCSALLGTLLIGQEPQFPLNNLPWPDQGISEKLQRLIFELDRLWQPLKSCRNHLSDAEQLAEDDFNGDPSGSEGDETDGQSQRLPTLPQLGPHDRRAYLLYITGMTQTRIAQELNKEYKTNYTQPRVSEILTRVKLHAEAGGVLDELESVRPKYERLRMNTMDPRNIDQGGRSDRRSQYLLVRERQGAFDNN
ncbi:MAG: hypothetical protein KF757_06230 [Phycisphaeraceae bacterium]|nr:hypothetical protein [Phycisphaeraceae bacterium]MCW5764332.1 hypothetical protein [Phycisphaeraceae bacterium]